METREEIIKHFAKKGFLLDLELASFFSFFQDNLAAEQMLNQLFSITKSRIFTRKLFLKYKAEIQALFLNLPKEKTEALSRFLQGGEALELREVAKEESKTIREEYRPPIKILSSNIIPDKRIEVKDFVNHFRNRYNFMKDLLKDRKELSGLVSINKVGGNRNFSLITLVSSKRITKNKNMILELEDTTGKISALIGADKEELFNKAKEIVSDDVIGVKCSGGKEFVYINDIFFPEAFIHEKKKLEEESYCLFISDIHFGSKLFLKNNFERFLSWLKGEDADEFQKEKLAKIKYLFITGDNVDGVGIYPSQESMLEVKDVKEQYKKLAEYLDSIPKHITIIMCPGQHDAVRVPEPQPPIGEEFAESLTKIKNLYLLSNPAMVEIAHTSSKPGFKVLMYHGASMHSWIDEIDELRQGKAHLNPAKVVKYLLRHRHLSPIHSGNVYIPSEKEDFLAIKEVPDIMLTGDLHRTDLDMYNNILIICGSCWQSITPFEEKVGNQPDPCKVPMLNLKTREIKILDFSDSVELKDLKPKEEILNAK